MWITLIKLLYAPPQHPKNKPDIYQGERLCGRLLPSVLRVSEKNSSRKLTEQARIPYAPVSHRVCGWMNTGFREYFFSDSR